MQSLGEHLMNVGYYSVLIGKELMLDKDSLDNLVFAAHYHDIGKLWIPNEIVYKKGKLTDEEFTVMKKHPFYSVDILSKNSLSEVIKKSILHHHEKWNGTGYPNNLKGENIPLLARIITIADAYDAITSQRAYSFTKSHEYAKREICEHSGEQFDPNLIDAFKDSIKEKLCVYNFDKVM